MERHEANDQSGARFKMNSVANYQHRCAIACVQSDDPAYRSLQQTVLLIPLKYSTAEAGRVDDFDND